MKTNVQVKDEPVELQVNELLRFYAYNLTDQSRTKSIGNQEQEPSTCAWCQKLGVRSFTLRTDNGDSKALCSEVCFNQYRRASFKKNRGAESDLDHNMLPIGSIVKNKSFEKKNGDHRVEQQSIDINRRKLLLPIRRPTPTISKIKPNGISQKHTPSPSSKRHRSSSSSSPPPHSNGKILRINQPATTPANLPVSLTWQPSLLLPSGIPWPSPIDINRFQYPFIPPPPPPPPPSLLPPAPLPITSSDHPPSSLFTTLAKGTLSNFTCILPTFIPLPIPIPIPLCFPIHLPCEKCSVEVNDQQCQTIMEEKRTRRISF